MARSSFRGGTAVETVGAILDLIRSSGTVSRSDLVERSGLTGASITKIVRHLLEDGLVVETGPGVSTGGKRPTMLQLNPGGRAALGVSLDEDRITYLAVDLGGRVVAQRSSKGAGTKKPDDVMRRVGDEINDFLGSVERDISVVGIGVAIAGRRGGPETGSYGSSGTVWTHRTLEDGLRAATDRPVIVENDSTCAAIGEYWIGRLASTEDLATVYMAEGFGLGLVIQGQTYRGSSSSAGEIGHIIVDPDGLPCDCGRRGCLHAMGGTVRVVELGLKDEKLVADLRLRGTRRTVRADFDRIARAAMSGDERAYALIRQSADYLASCLVSINNVLDLDQVILAGPGFSTVGQIYADAAADQLARTGWSRSTSTVRVGLSSMGDDVAALGAASLVMHSELTLGNRATQASARSRRRA